LFSKSFSAEFNYDTSVFEYSFKFDSKLYYIESNLSLRNLILSIDLDLDTSVYV